jgi:mRNA-degrading endonuclease RelE of RelBE toxin-antitoxin system
MAWTIDIDPVALEQTSKLPAKHQRQIKESIERMKADPFQGNVEPLKGAEWQGRYRKRAGRYRIFFSLNHQTNTITILKVELRSEKTYRK